MTCLQTIPSLIAGIGLGVVLLEDKIVFNSLIDRQDMRVKGFIHMALAYKCALKYIMRNYGPLHCHIIQRSGWPSFFSMSKYWVENILIIPLYILYLVWS